MTRQMTSIKRSTILFYSAFNIGCSFAYKIQSVKRFMAFLKYINLQYWGFIEPLSQCDGYLFRICFLFGVTQQIFRKKRNNFPFFDVHFVHSYHQQHLSPNLYKHLTDYYSQGFDTEHDWDYAHELLQSIQANISCSHDTVPSCPCFVMGLWEEHIILNPANTFFSKIAWRDVLISWRGST